MTPAEHYAEAERLIGWTANAPAGSDRALIVAEAQVHATLATVDPDAVKVWRKVVPGSTDSPLVKLCTCNTITVEPLARTHTDPACPIHGSGS